MKSCGIVCEYNPFHNGHKYHIEQSKNLCDSDIFIAVMSGNYVQRGEIAIIDKWERSKIAIENGIDLVVELPYVFSTQSANNFSKGAIDILKLLKIDYLSFGSETNNLENLKEIADAPINMEHIKECMNTGNSFPKAYGLLSKEMGPNDILAVNYLREIKDTNIIPISIQRTNSYNSLDINTISSASAIRNAIYKNTDIKDSTVMKDILLNNQIVSLNDAYPYIRNLILTLDKNYLSNIFLFSEGIENLFKKVAYRASSLDEFINICTNKRYTSSRIKRSLLQLFNQIKKEDINKLEPINTVRILAMNDKGRDYIKTLEGVNIASRFSKIQDGYKEIEYKTTLSYAGLFDEKKRVYLIEKEIGGPLIFF